VSDSEPPDPTHPLEQLYEEHARQCGVLALQWRIAERKRSGFNRSDRRGYYDRMLAALEKAVDGYMDETDPPEWR
jgi:hypothetical protein